jgi:hypothetical protein
MPPPRTNEGEKKPRRVARLATDSPERLDCCACCSRLMRTNMHMSQHDDSHDPNPRRPLRMSLGCVLL